MEYLQDATDICLSGGADGADAEWGRCAGLIGHKVVHWSFPGHRSQVPEGQLVRLDDEQLKLADEAVADAAVVLGKHVPRRPVVARLLKRNFYQVAWSRACYAVTVIQEDPALVGGTAWATTMFARLHPDSRELYVFDQEKDVWLQFVDGGWNRIDSPPKPTGIWAGIGSRDLRRNGRDAIRKLMGCVDGESVDS